MTSNIYGSTYFEVKKYLKNQAKKRRRLKPSRKETKERGQRRKGNGTKAKGK